MATGEHALKPATLAMCEHALKPATLAMGEQAVKPATLAPGEPAVKPATQATGEQDVKPATLATGEHALKPAARYTCPAPCTEANLKVQQCSLSMACSQTHCCLHQVLRAQSIVFMDMNDPHVQLCKSQAKHCTGYCQDNHCAAG